MINFPSAIRPVLDTLREFFRRLIRHTEIEDLGSALEDFARMRSEILDLIRAAGLENTVPPVLISTADNPPFMQDERSCLVENVFRLIGYAEPKIVQYLSNLVKSHDFESLRVQLEAVGIEQGDIAELEAALALDPNPLTIGKLGPNVSSWLDGMSLKARNGQWIVRVAADSSVVTNLVAKYMGF